MVTAARVAVWAMAFGSSCGALFLTVNARAESANEDKEKDHEAVVLVEVAKVEELADVITYPARVISTVKGVIYSRCDGLVTRILAPLGTTVKANTEIIEVKNTDPAYDYRPMSMEAPVSGVVSAVDVTEGSAVNKGQSLATVTDPHKMELRVEVPAADLGSFHQGLIGEFKLPLLGPNFKPLVVKVRGVSPLVDPLTGTATAEVGFASSPVGAKGVPVPLGALGKVAFSVNKRDGIQVAEQAIIYRGKDTLVRTMVGGRAKLVPVVLGETYRGRTEVVTGLSPGAVVVVSASSFIAEGQAIKTQDSGVSKTK